jgi:hypothetical protein
MSQSFSPPMPKTVTPASPWRGACYLAGYVLGSAVFAALAGVAREWRDRAAWRQLGRAARLWLPLALLDTVLLSVWGWFLGMITLPAWYWAPWMDVHGQRFHGYQLGFWFPHGPSGPGTVGVFIDTLPKALIAAAIGIAGFVASSYLIVVTARAQS